MFLVIFYTYSINYCNTHAISKTAWNLHIEEVSTKYVLALKNYKNNMIKGVCFNKTGYMFEPNC